MKAIIQQAINIAIAAPEYNPPLPKLDDAVWRKLLDWKENHFSNNCLEWLGDALMYAAISVELYRQVPTGSPHMYATIRGPIVTNQTFALLVNKLHLSGALIHASRSKMRSLSPTDKCFADLFEVIPAEVYLHDGFDVLRKWVAEVFAPLIKAAVRAYETRPHPINKKRKHFEGQDFPTTNVTKENIRAPKRQMIGHVNYPTSQVIPALSGIHAANRSSQFVAGPSTSSTCLLGAINPLTSSALPNGPSVGQGCNNNTALARTRDSLMALSSAPTRLWLSNNIRHLSFVSDSTRGSSSRKQIQNGSVQEPAPSKTATDMRSHVATHSAAWQRAFARAPDPGLQAVLSSPSRYTAAPPSEPACGPGSSCFDPIIIDSDNDDDTQLERGSRDASREVIELSDDEQDENLL